MISALRSWLSSIVVVSLLLSVARTLTPEGPIRRIGSFTGGLILIAVLLTPLRGWKTDWPELDYETYQEAIARRRDELDREGEAELQQLVARRVERLIEEQAETAGEMLSAAVEIRMEEGTPLPWSVEVSGPWDADLSRWIETELGIPRSRQSWQSP